VQGTAAVSVRADSQDDLPIVRFHRPVGPAAAFVLHRHERPQLLLGPWLGPTQDMFALANQSSQLMGELFAKVSDVLRPDVVLHDLSLIFELVAAVRGPNPPRTQELRHRYLALILDGLRARDREELPGPPPGWQELSDRWIPKAAS
jgi:hypothetical protein